MDARSAAQDKDFTFHPVSGLLGRRRGGRRDSAAAVNHQSLGLNLITPIVYGGELKWDLQELKVLGSYIMSSM